MSTAAAIMVDECGNITVLHAEPGASVCVDERGVITVTRRVPEPSDEYMHAERAHEERNGRPQRAPWR